MAGGMQFSFLADVRDFLKGTKKIEDAVKNDVIDSLDDVSKSTDKSTTKMERSLSEAAEAAKSVGAATEKAGYDVNASLDNTEPHFGSFKKNAKAAAKTVAESFDGSIESIGSVAQTAATQLFSILPGIAGGAAVAATGVLIGSINAVLAEAGKSAEESKKRVKDWAVAMVDYAGAIGEIDLSQLASGLKDISTGSKDGVKNFKDLKKSADEAGVSVETYALSQLGGKQAIDQVSKSIQNQIDYYNSLYEAQGLSESRYKKIPDDLSKAQVEVNKLQREYDAAAEAEKNFLAVGGDIYAAKAEAISQINDAYDDAVGSVTDFINEESGVLDVDAYLNAIQARRVALMDYQRTLVSGAFTTDQKAALNAMGIEQASALLKGWETYSPEQKRRIKASLTQSASEGSAAAQGVLREAFKTPVDQKIDAKTDAKQMADTRDGVIRYFNTPITQKVIIDAYTRSGKKID